MEPEGVSIEKSLTHLKMNRRVNKIVVDHAIILSVLIVFDFSG